MISDAAMELLSLTLILQNNAVLSTVNAETDDAQEPISVLEIKKCSCKTTKPVKNTSRTHVFDLQSILSRQPGSRSRMARCLNTGRFRSAHDKTANIVDNTQLSVKR